MSKSINGWTHWSAGNIQFAGKAPACIKCVSCSSFCHTGDEAHPYGCIESTNESAASLCARETQQPYECKYYSTRGSKPITSYVQGGAAGQSAGRNFRDAVGITTDMRNVERLANDAGAGLAVGAAKLIAKGVSAATAKERAEQARKDAEYEILYEQRKAEKEAVFSALSFTKFGKDAAANEGSLNEVLGIVAAYSYELDFPYGPKGPCLGVKEDDTYKKEIWKKAEKKAEEGIATLRKQGSTSEAQAFEARLQAERDKVDPKFVKERLAVQKEAEKQAEKDMRAEQLQTLKNVPGEIKDNFKSIGEVFKKSSGESPEVKAAEQAVKAAEKAEKAAERAEKTAELKEKAGATVDEIKKDGIGGFLGKKLESLGDTASGKTDDLTDKLKQGIGGLGGLFGKKK